IQISKESHRRISFNRLAVDFRNVFGLLAGLRSKIPADNAMLSEIRIDSEIELGFKELGPKIRRWTPDDNRVSRRKVAQRYVPRVANNNATREPFRNLQDPNSRTDAVKRCIVALVKFKEHRVERGGTRSRSP